MVRCYFGISLLLLLCAASTHAQLVPLELDQTITLPQAGAIWDVMPHPDGYYLWVQAVQPDSEVTRTYWGRTDSVGVDSFDLAVGAPQAVVGFWRANYDCNILLASRFVRSFDSTNFRMYSLTDGRPESPIWHWDSYSTGTSYETSSQTNYHLVGGLPTPPPPAPSMSLNIAVGSSYDHHIHDHDMEIFESDARGVIVHCSFADTGNASFGPELTLDRAAFASSGQDIAVGLSGSAYYASNPSNQWYSSMWYVGGAYPYAIPMQCREMNTHCRSGLVACALHSGTGRPVLFTTYHDTAYVAADPDGPLWNLPFASPAGDYNLLLAAHVIAGNAFEEFLGYHSTRHYFDIFEAASGFFYGVTDTITLGSEPRIIGRYDSTSRRLAFRVGNQLKLYRFGEYLAVDRPLSPYPLALSLSSFPNPFNPTTQIAFTLPRAEKVLLAVFDLTGRKVKTLVEGRFATGEHSVSFDGSSLPSGMYLARLTSGTFSKTQKLLLLK